MQPYGRNLQIGMSGEDVASAQRDLIRLGQQIADAELRDRRFGLSTAHAVGEFQQDHGLVPNAIIDAGTASALVQAVAALPLLAPASGPAAGFAPDETVMVTPANAPDVGVAPAAGSTSPADPAGPIAGTTAPEAHTTLSPRETPVAGPVTRPAAAVGTGPGEIAGGPRATTPPGTTVASGATVPPGSAIPPGATAAPATTIPPGSADTARGNTPTGSVSGRVYLDHGAAAANVSLRVYDIGFGGSAKLLGTVTTAADGSYTLGYQTGDGQPANLEVRAVATDGSEVTLSYPSFAAAGNQALNLVAPAAQVAPAAPEYERLIADVRPHLGDANLGTARETADRGDLTLLAANSGWDGRLIALAATASSLATTTGIDTTALYGLLRAGLPTDAAELARVSPNAVTAALNAAAAAGIIPSDPASISAATNAFTMYARTTRLRTIASGAVSSNGDMLAAAGLNPTAQTSFDDIWAAHADDPATMWATAKQAGLPVTALQTAGQLSYLTLNNAILTTALRQLADAPEKLGPALVAAGLYRTQPWVDYIRKLAATDDALAKLIPPPFTIAPPNPAGGNTPSKRAAGAKTDAPVAPAAAAGTRSVADSLSAYADDLARKVRLAWPTPVVATMISKDELRLGVNHDAVKGDVGIFFDRATPLGYDLGGSPVGPFVRDNATTLFSGLTKDRVTQVTTAVATLHRLYQITPDNDALSAMYSAGFVSARQVANVPYQRFVDRYGQVVGGADKADLIWRKAQQISSVTYSFFGAASQLNSAPMLPVMTGGQPAQQAAQQALVEQYPTMAELFGSLDFCACADCRSVLSPAAYLVDLLRFLDPDPTVWTGDLAEWAATHQGTTYPYPDPASYTAAGSPAPVTPYDALTARRPDLVALPLTCENTNTAMPYLDVVNEIMEYAVAHGALDAGAAHDTGAAQSADLIAEPQNILPAVYDTTLKQAEYPLALPFDLWLSTVRRYLDHFDTPLAAVLDALCPTDALDPTGPQAYGRRAVFLERLRVAGVDHALLTAADVSRWYQLYGYADEPTALAALPNAKTLADRLGVSYVDLVTLVSSGFVNPTLANFAALGKLGISIEDVLRYKGQAGYPAFSAEEHVGFAAKLGGAAAWLDATWAAGEFASALVLQDPDAGCGFDQTKLCHADGSAASPITFILLNYLVRLWRRLGWRLTDLDRALVAFLPAAPDPRTTTAIGAAMDSALLGLAHLDALATQFGGGDDRRAALVRLWSDLTPAEYAALFLRPGVVAADPVLDQPAGQYLTWLNGGVYQPFTYDSGQPDNPATGNVGLTNHLGAVQAALKLSASDIGLIVDVASAPLSMAVVSTLARHALLASSLHMPVKDLLSAIAVTGVDPFTPPLADAAHDRPQAFVDAVTALRTAGLTVADLDYLTRHRYDAVGPYRGAGAAPVALINTLSTQIATVRAQQAVPDDALTFTDDKLSQALALALPADAAATFMGMWTGSVTYQAAVTSAQVLDPHDFAAEPAFDIGYDTVRGQQTITYRGVLVDTEVTRLKTAHPQPVFGQLLDAITAQSTAFFDGYLLVRTVGTTPSGFLQAADFDTLFAAEPSGLTEPQRQDHERARRALIAGALLPYLQSVLIRQAVIAALTPTGSTDTTPLVTALVGDPTLVSDRAHPGAPLLDAFTAADAAGATVTSTSTDTTVAGFLQVPESGPYRFFVTCPTSGSAVELSLAALTDPLLRETTTTTNQELSAFTTLTAGTVYAFTLTATATGGAALTVAVQGEHLPKGLLDQLVVWPAAGVERIRRANVLLGKALTIAAKLGLSADEVVHLLGHSADFAGVDLSWLPTGSADDDAGHVTMLTGQLLRLAGYATLRKALAADPADLLDVLVHARREFPSTATPAIAEGQVLTDVCTRLGAIVRRDATTVAAAVTALGYTPTSTMSGDTLSVAVPAFVDERGLRRIWRVLATAATLGVTPPALARWATPAPDSTVARDVHDTVKAIYDQATWRVVVQPISDALRQARRDALVAYLLNSLGFTSVDQLYEYFLVDPGTEPVVQTSRVRLAIASVQLFVQRCLLNLEHKVSPWAIDSDRWQWMKRYRVWQANREIFLWPENWLEPEWRDDKTHLFQAVESALIQGNLGADDAEAAFMSYLRSLELLSRLDIRSVWLEEALDPASNTLHVIGRTHNTPFKYFYRTFSHQAWTPWIPVDADIEGEHATLVVWRGRPHIFWVTFMDKKPDNPDTRTPSKLADVQSDQIAPPRVVEAQLHWTEYFQGTWTGRGGGGFNRPVHTTVSQGFVDDSLFTYATIDPNDGAVWINLRGEVYASFRVPSKVAPPQPFNNIEGEQTPSPLLVSDGPDTYRSGSETLAVRYGREVGTGLTAYQSRQGVETADILASTPDYTVVSSSGAIVNPPGELGRLVNPFFYQDERSTFFVQPSVTETTVLEWNGWVIGPSPRRVDYNAAYFQHLQLAAQIPVRQPGPPPGPIDPISRYTVSTPRDWATAADTNVLYGGVPIGATGGMTLGGLAGGRIGPGGTVQGGLVLRGPALGGIATINSTER